MQTRLEKAKELRPDLTEEKIVYGGLCPYNWFPLKGFINKAFPAHKCVKNEGGSHDCVACWNEPYEGGDKGETP
jgi:hypothetical protein